MSGVLQSCRNSVLIGELRRRDESLTSCASDPSVHVQTRVRRRLIGPRTNECRGGRPALALHVNGDKAFYYQIFMNGCASLPVLYACG